MAEGGVETISETLDSISLSSTPDELDALGKALNISDEHGMLTDDMVRKVKCCEEQKEKKEKDNRERQKVDDQRQNREDRKREQQERQKHELENERRKHEKENGGTGNAHKNTTKATENDTATIIGGNVNVLTEKARRNEKKNRYNVRFIMR